MEIETQYIPNSLLREERETIINCTINEDGSFLWEAESSIPTHITKLKKAGWKPTSQLISRSSNSVQSMSFRAKTKSPLAFRDLAKPSKVYSEVEKEKFKKRIALAKKNRDLN